MKTVKLYDAGLTLVLCLWGAFTLITMHSNNTGNHETHPEWDNPPIEYKTKG
jgi:hypothetical protein